MYPRINNGLFREMNQFIKSFMPVKPDSLIHHQRIGVESTRILTIIISFVCKVRHHINFSIQYFIVKNIFRRAMS